MGAIVVADSEEICDEALRLIADGIEWEQLPVLVNHADTIKPDAPLMHPERNAENNILERRRHAQYR